MSHLKKRLFPAVALVLALTGGAIALATGGSSTDPLISLGYITGTLKPDILAQADTAISTSTNAAYATAAATLEQKAAAYLAQTGENQAASDLSYSAAFSQLALKRGDAFTESTGAGFLLITGSAAVTHTGTVVDVTAGATVVSGGSLTANHRYLVGEDTTAVFTIVSDAATAAVEGYYTAAYSEYDTLPYTDICSTDWYYSYVKYAVEHGLFAGTSATTFAPRMDMNRGMVVTVLYSLSGSPASSASNKFYDVAQSAYYAGPVTWATSVGVAAGTGTNYFSPTKSITREQIACMLYSYAGGFAGLDVSGRADLSGFTDASQIASYAEDAMAWAVDVGIIGGTSSTTISPKGTATRAQVAAMLQNFKSLL